MYSLKNLLILVLSIVCIQISTAQISKVAVASVYSERQLDPGDFDNSLTVAIASLSENKNFDLVPITSTFYTKLCDEILTQFEFESVYGEDAWSRDGYDQVLDNSVIEFQPYMVNTIGDYKAIFSFGLLRDRKGISKALEVFETEDAIMIAGVNFRLDKKAQILGFGTAKVQAFGHIRIYNKKGKEIFKIKEKGQSADSFKFALGGSVFDATEIQNLVNQAAEDLFVEMDKNLPKQIGKMNKKLAKMK